MVLLLLFAGSGCSALIYEVVWYQLLQLTIGSTAVSLGILLATLMGGLCIGSLVLPRLRLQKIHALRTYAGIEAGIALFGLLELVLIPAVDTLYVVAVQQGFTGMLARAFVCAVALLPPTILMGASLPAIARFAAAARGPAWWGALYAANTLGAVSGCVLAGFYLLRLYDVTTASLAAAAINLGVAAASLLLARFIPADAAPVPHDAAAPAARRDFAPHIVIAVSGACALGAEVVWTRLLGLMFGATVYAFSIILAVFLIGLAIGTAAASALLRRSGGRFALGLVQILNVFAMAWTALMIADYLPYWPVEQLLSRNPLIVFQTDFLRALTAMLPPTLLWGASFPLAFAAARNSNPGEAVGEIYAANTFGAIFGALGVSLILIPWMGTQDSQRVLMALSGLSGLFVVVPIIFKARPQLKIMGTVAGIAAAAACAFLIVHTARVPDELIAYGRLMLPNRGASTILYAAEGRNTSIAVSREHADDTLQFHVAGKVEASTSDLDMKLQRILGHLAALEMPDPHSALIVGFGAGVTAGSFTTYPGIKRIVICELEPLIPPASTRYFAPQNYNVMHNPRTQIVYDDARHFVLTTPEKFDVITSDPIHPFVKGSAALYSREYFESVKAHLTPDGVVTQWVPLYESDAASVKSEIATFLAVFPDAMIFSNSRVGEGYDLALLGQNHPHTIDIDAAQARLASPQYARVVASLRDVGFVSAEALFGIYAGRGTDLQPWLADAQINHDRNLRLQYLAGMAVNQIQAVAIFKQILRYRKKADAPFSGSPASLDLWRRFMEADAQ
jgi:spermidine synthase